MMSGDLPRGWVRARVDEVAEVRLGRQRSPSNRAGKFARPYVRAANVTWKGLDLSDVMEMDFRPHEVETFRLRPGDILLSEASGSPGEVGKPALWRGEIPDCCFQNTLIRVRSRGAVPEFLRYRFLSDALNGRFIDASRGIGIHHLGAERLSALEIDVPPVAEQHRIVAAIEEHLSDLDAGVAALRRVQANLKRYRAAILKAGVQGQLLPTEAELSRIGEREYQPAGALLLVRNNPNNRGRKPGRLWGAGVVPELREDEKALPEGWAWAKVSELGGTPEDTVQIGPMSMKSSEFEPDGVVPVLNVGCVRWGWIDKTKVDHLSEQMAVRFDRYRIAAGDVLFTRSGAVGRCALATERHEGWLMTFHLLRVRVDQNKCLPAYLRHVLEGAPHIRRQCREASVGTTRAGFNTTLLANLDIPLPPLVEQRRIVSGIDERLSLIADVERSVLSNLVRSSHFRRTVLKHAFEGKLVPHNPADEPSSGLPSHASPSGEAEASLHTRKRRSASAAKSLSSAR